MRCIVHDAVRVLQRVLAKIALSIRRTNTAELSSGQLGFRSTEHENDSDVDDDAMAIHCSRSSSLQLSPAITCQRYVTDVNTCRAGQKYDLYIRPESKLTPV